MEIPGNLKIRRHGSKGPVVIALHGGPGAMGSAVDLARGLADNFTVIEPWQRGSGGESPLTVARHVEDLDDIVGSAQETGLPALVGESWGAMLALSYAARYPEKTGPIALIGCGTFDKTSRALAMNVRQNRIAEHIAAHPEHSADLDLDINERIMKWHAITDNYKALSPVPHTESEPFDMNAHTQTWEDMLQCQEMGLYPRAFAAIRSPVIMLHGSYDPHPGKMIRDSLKPYLPQLEYLELEKCGHSPAKEKYAKKIFFTILGKWLTTHCV